MTADKELKAVLALMKKDYPEMTDYNVEGDMVQILNVGKIIGVISEERLTEYWNEIELAHCENCQTPITLCDCLGPNAPRRYKREDIVELILAVHDHLGNLIDAEQDKNPETGEMYEDVTRLMNAVKKLEGGK